MGQHHYHHFVDQRGGMTELSYLNEKQGKSKAGENGLWHQPGQQMCPSILESALS